MTCKSRVWLVNAVINGWNRVGRLHNISKGCDSFPNLAWVRNALCTWLFFKHNFFWKYLKLLRIILYFIYDLFIYLFINFKRKTLLAHRSHFSLLIGYFCKSNRSICLRIWTAEPEVRGTNKQKQEVYMWGYNSFIERLVFMLSIAIRCLVSLI